MFLFLKENLFQFILIFILLWILAYATNITSIPDSVILFENDQLSLQTIAGVKVEEANTEENEQTVSVGVSPLGNPQQNENNYVGAGLVPTRTTTTK